MIFPGSDFRNAGTSFWGASGVSDLRIKALGFEVLLLELLNKSLLPRIPLRKFRDMVAAARISTLCISGNLITLALFGFQQLGT